MEYVPYRSRMVHAMEMLDIFPVIREIHHGLQIHIIPGIIENVLHNPVIISNGHIIIMVRVIRRNTKLIPPGYWNTGLIGILPAGNIDEHHPFLCRR